VTEKFPIRVLVADESKDQFRMTTSIARLADGSRSVRSELAYLEADYTILIGAVRRSLASASQKHRADPRLMWLAADHMSNFLARLDDTGFYLLRQNDTLARHLGVSAPSIRKLLSFRRRFPRVSMVDPTVPWSMYRDNRVRRPLAKGEGK